MARNTANLFAGVGQTSQYNPVSQNDEDKEQDLDLFGVDLGNGNSKGST